MIALGGPTLKLKIDGLVSRTINSLNDSTGRAYTETQGGLQSPECPRCLNDSTGRAYTETTSLFPIERAMLRLNDSTGRAYTETPPL